jgi:hypothetical protein
LWYKQAIPILVPEYSEASELMFLGQPRIRERRFLQEESAFLLVRTELFDIAKCDIKILGWATEAAQRVHRARGHHGGERAEQWPSN